MEDLLKKGKNTVLIVDMMFTVLMKMIIFEGVIMICPRCGSWIDAGEPYFPD